MIRIRALVNGNFNYSKFNEFFQNTPSVNEGFSQTYGADLRTNFKTAPNIEMNYLYSV